MRVFRLATAVATALAALAGCTSGEAVPDPGQATPGEDWSGAQPELDAAVMRVAPGAVDPKLIDYPLDAYALSNDDVHLINNAIALVEQACFREFGLDLPIPDPPDGRPFPVWDWYGLWDAETARSLGYVSPPLMTGGEPFEGTVPQEWNDVLIGRVSTRNGVEVPEGGCQGEAKRAIGAEDSAGLVSVAELQRDAVVRARQHSAVEDLIGEWSDCLGKRGWDFADPAEPFRQPPSGRDTTGASEVPAEEIELALADIDCKTSTGLLRTWVAADVAHQRLLVEANAEALGELQDWRGTVLDRADAIVSGA